MHWYTILLFVFYLIVELFGIVVLFNCCTSEFGACFDFVLRIVLMYCLLI